MSFKRASPGRWTGVLAADPTSERYSRRVASSVTAPEPASEHLRLVKEVIGLWVEMQARLETHFSALAAEQGLSALQAKLLGHLDGETPVSMRALALRLRYDPSNLTTVVDRLEERGALVRRPDPNDRRVKGLLLTDEGLRLRGAFWERLTNEVGPMGHLGAADLARLRDVLRVALSPAGQ
jgi:DNA-binding MarR family transcriptional regulator